MRRTTVVCAALLLALVHAAPASAVMIGLTDTFEDATTQNWVVGLLGAVSPVPPVNVATGGPSGVDDNFLQLESIGGGGPGSRLAAINLAQWAGDYLAAGVTGIRMNVRNLGATDISLRLYFENPMGAPPTDDAVSDAVLLPAGGDWTSVFFHVGATSLTVLNGDINTLLAGVTALRLIHAPAVGFPGPASVALLGVDNIRAVPEPGSLALLLAGLASVTRYRRLRKRSAGV